VGNIKIFGGAHIDYGPDVAQACSSIASSFFNFKGFSAIQKDLFK